MNNPRGVRRRQRSPNLHDEIDDLTDGQRSIRKSFAERTTFDEFRGHKMQAVFLANFVDGDDVGIVECGGGTGFTLEAPHLGEVSREPPR
jgi:hypothetical protein